MRITLSNENVSVVLPIKFSDEIRQSGKGNYQWMATNTEKFKTDMWGIDLNDLLKPTKDGGIWGITEDEVPVKCRKGEYAYYKVIHSLFSSKLSPTRFPASNLFKPSDDKTSFDNLLIGDYDCEGMLAALKLRDFEITVVLSVREKDGNYYQSVIALPEYIDRGGSTYLEKNLEKAKALGRSITTDIWTVDFQEFARPVKVEEKTEEIPF